MQRGAGTEQLLVGRQGLDASSDRHAIQFSVTPVRHDELAHVEVALDDLVQVARAGFTENVKGPPDLFGPDVRFSVSSTVIGPS